MLRSLIAGSTSLMLVATALPAFAGDASTTRIEPRPFYGATVTVEAGVRVFRPLPPTRQVIINPNRTPLNLSFEDVRETRESHNYFYDRRQNSSGRSDRPIYYGSAGVVGKGRARHGKRRRLAGDRGGFRRGGH